MIIAMTAQQVLWNVSKNGQVWLVLTDGEREVHCRLTKEQRRKLENGLALLQD